MQLCIEACVGVSTVNMPSGSDSLAQFRDMPHVFEDPQVMAVEIEDAYLEGETDAVVYSYCEVFALRGLDSQVTPQFFEIFCGRN